MLVGARAVRRQTGDHADRKLSLADQRANGGHDGAGELAEQAAAIGQYARSRFGMVSTTWRCGTGASSEVSSHCVQIPRRLAWQLG